jgi:uncharacterized membrane protein YheB (UPF0754 family)
MLAVAIGAVIGYLTNWLAIKMLFRPHRAYHIFGLRIPFTPGLFVKRRRDFARSIAHMIEDRFTETDDLVAAFYEAQKKGLVREFVESMGPLFKAGWNLYMSKTNGESFKRDLEKLAESLHKGNIVSDTVCDKIEKMSTIEIETLVMAVVHRELRAITWLGALIGAMIGGSQVLL